MLPSSRPTVPVFIVGVRAVQQAPVLVSPCRTFPAVKAEKVRSEMEEGDSVIREQQIEEADLRFSGVDKSF